MAHLTRTEFLKYFDEFSSVSVPKVNTFLDAASSRVSKDVWGEDCYKLATAYLAAHMLAGVGGSGGIGSAAAAGPVTSESVGDLSRSYGQLNLNSDDEKLYSTTKYGLEYLALRKTCVFPATLTGC